jgi:hypothetical protein
MTDDSMRKDVGRIQEMMHYYGFDKFTQLLCTAIHLKNSEVFRQDEMSKEIYSQFKELSSVLRLLRELKGLKET